MDIGSAFVFYFSGTGTTEKYAKAFASALPYQTKTIDLFVKDPISGPCTQADLLVLAAPVYAGRIPGYVWQRLSDIEGHGTPAVIMAVYGARDYDDALLEMQHGLAEKGFTTVAAAALVARHSMVPTIASDRPDADDLDEVRAFATTVAERLASAATPADFPTFTFKGSLEPKEIHLAVPVATDECVECGICADECPTGAIDHDDPKTADASKCISCMHCIEVCPPDARIVPEEVMAQVKPMLEAVCDPKKANELF